MARCSSTTFFAFSTAVGPAARISLVIHNSLKSCPGHSRSLRKLSLGLTLGQWHIINGIYPLLLMFSLPPTPPLPLACNAGWFCEARALAKVLHVLIEDFVQRRNATVQFARIFRQKPLWQLAITLGL